MVDGGRRTFALGLADARPDLARAFQLVERADLSWVARRHQENQNRPQLTLIQSSSPALSRLTSTYQLSW